MTRSTGRREAEKTREDLFVEDLVLNRVLRHLSESAAWAGRFPYGEEFQGIRQAWVLVKLRLLDMADEQKALR